LVQRTNGVMHALSFACSTTEPRGAYTSYACPLIRGSLPTRPDSKLNDNPVVRIRSDTVIDEKVSITKWSSDGVSSMIH
jgi:hypothetical protein